MKACNLRYSRISGSNRNHGCSRLQRRIGIRGTRWRISSFRDRKMNRRGSRSLFRIINYTGMVTHLESRRGRMVKNLMINLNLRYLQLLNLQHFNWKMILKPRGGSMRSLIRRRNLDQRLQGGDRRFTHELSWSIRYWSRIQGWRMQIWVRFMDIRSHWRSLELTLRRRRRSE